MESTPANDFPILLYDVARHMRTHVDRIAREHGTTRAQWAILARLERQPGMSQNELAGIAELAPITVARLIDKLQAAGLVERQPDPNDRRIWRLQLTPAATPVLDEIKKFRAELLAVMTKGVDPATLEAMTAGLLQMKDNLSDSRRLSETAA